MEISLLYRKGILNRIIYVKFLSFSPLNEWASTFILIMGSGHKVGPHLLKMSSHCPPSSPLVGLNDDGPAPTHA